LATVITAETKMCKPSCCGETARLGFRRYFICYVLNV